MVRSPVASHPAERAAAGRDLGAAEQVLLGLFHEGEHQSTSRRVRLRAFWALHAIGKLRPELAINDHDEVVRRWAVRLTFEDRKPSETTLEVMRTMAMGEKPSVLLAIASGLQHIPAVSRWKLAEALLKRIDQPKDEYLSLMTWYAVEPLAAADSARGRTCETRGLAAASTVSCTSDLGRTEGERVARRAARSAGRPGVAARRARRNE